LIVDDDEPYEIPTITLTSRGEDTSYGIISQFDGEDVGRNDRHVTDTDKITPVDEIIASLTQGLEGSHANDDLFTTVSVQYAEGERLGLGLIPNPMIGGVCISAVEPGSPAANTGTLCVGDHIQSVNGEDVSFAKPETVSRHIAAARGDLTLGIRVLGENSQEQGATDYQNRHIDFQKTDVAFKTRLAIPRGENGTFGLGVDHSMDKGNFIVTVKPGSSAETHGARAGYRILTCNDVDVSFDTSAETLESAMQMSRVLVLEVTLDESPPGVDMPVDVSVTLNNADADDQKLDDIRRKADELRQRTADIRRQREEDKKRRSRFDTTPL
jgi:C-terminal processing protease CtpA/Prc